MHIFVVAARVINNQNNLLLDTVLAAFQKPWQLSVALLPHPHHQPAAMCTQSQVTVSNDNLTSVLEKDWRQTLGAFFQHTHKNGIIYHPG